MLFARFSLAIAVMLVASGCVQTGLPLVPPPDRPIDAVVYDRPLAAPPPAVAVAPIPAPPPPPVFVPGPAVVPVAGSADRIEPPYTLDSGDKLRVTIFGQEGLTNSYSVDTAGRISMPLIGQVPARGHTTAQLSAAIAARLRNGYLREPHVAVEVEAYRPFFILGEVTYPGQYPFVAHMTVETAVAIAGGFTPRAYRWDAEVTRPTPDGPVKLKAPPMFLLQPGDTVVVSERWF
jgi:polysaccharide export outer membrane protein